MKDHLAHDQLESRQPMDQKKVAIVIIEPNEADRDRLQADVNEIFLGKFFVHGCASMDEAITILTKLKQDQALIPFMIASFSLEGETGIDFFEKMRVLNLDPHSFHVLLHEQNDRLPKFGPQDPTIESHVDIWLSKPWQKEEISESLRQLVSKYFIQYWPDQIKHYHRLIPHKLLGEAFLSSEKGRQELRSRLGRLTSSLLDSRSSSDEQLWQELVREIRHFCYEQKEENIFRSYAKGATMFEEGQFQDKLWFITKGDVVHSKKIDDHQQRDVIVEGVGSVCGIMSFLKSGKTYTTLKAATEVEVAVLSKQLLVKAIEENTVFLNLFMSSLLRQLNQRVRHSTEMKLVLEETIDNLAQTQDALVESEKMATLGQLIAGIAHELNNPASAILRGADQLSDLVPKVLKSKLEDKYRDLGLSILASSLQHTPLPTAELRERTKNALALFGDRNTTQKAVLLNLHEPDVYKSYFAGSSKTEIASLINELEDFYQIGNFLRSILSCTDRIAGLVKSLKSYARPDDATKVEVDIHKGIEETLMIFHHKLKHLMVEKDYGTLPPLKCYPAQLNQVWTNIVANAIDAMPDQGGRLSITTKLIQREKLPCILVQIEDNGKGIPVEMREKIFESHFTTKRGTDFGLGLGLSIVRKIINRHNGQISLDSKVGSFTRFSITLPIQHQPGEPI
jgi:signal transduction histidine kinase